MAPIWERFTPYGKLIPRLMMKLGIWLLKRSNAYETTTRVQVSYIELHRDKVGELIKEAANDFYRVTGVPPTCVILGRKQQSQLFREVFSSPVYVDTMFKLHLNQFAGLQLVLHPLIDGIVVMKGHVG